MWKLLLDSFLGLSGITGFHFGRAYLAIETDSDLVGVEYGCGWIEGSDFRKPAFFKGCATIHGSLSRVLRAAGDQPRLTCCPRRFPGFTPPSHS
jgi:hypothetical protein